MCNFLLAELIFPGFIDELFPWEPSGDGIQLIHWKFWSARHAFTAANHNHVLVDSPEGVNAGLDVLKLWC